MPCGYGQYKWQNGDLYIGHFEQGMKSGFGKWRQQPSNPDQPMKFNQFEGEYKNDVKEGKGIFIWEAGNRYEGDYSGDERHGWGTMSWIDGSKYLG